MNADPNNQPQQAKKIWLAPELNKIAVRETESGPFQPNAESGACQPVPS
ncbi:hypothetical protein [Roseofilum capinflatum]|uniref:Uncharacterized protein n=1 Tax=Roseofilum capinflatum BLCC-M114 TaxID=3022440 RepID=A0ABT7B487_9CYAN|nr:hypothetical protein [Roseofilum capinflatum]MDJ1173964.1 hypothetical protein [Roseofilum capinflatum BLCC-M114]